MAAADLLAECTIRWDYSPIWFWTFGLDNRRCLLESCNSGQCSCNIWIKRRRINEITKTSKIEKLEGIGDIIVAYNRVTARFDDLYIKFGNNAVTIDVALAARSLRKSDCDYQPNVC